MEQFIKLTSNGNIIMKNLLTARYFNYNMRLCGFANPTTPFIIKEYRLNALWDSCQIVMKK